MVCSIAIISLRLSKVKATAEQIVVPKYERRALVDEKFIELLAYDPVQGPIFPKKNSDETLLPLHRGSRYSVITKEFFRCKGSSLHSLIPILSDGKVVENIFDCSGSSTHSLPIRDGNEYIYPVLIEILNAIQVQTRKQVVITSGHRCPQHHRYVTAKGGPHCAKHMMGACVTFYVAGLEDKPKEVMKAIFAYYLKLPVSEKEKKKYTEFTRFEKSTDVSTLPWLNKEVMIKYYKAQEGRDGDNAHPFPYFSIQVRFDREKNAPVQYQNCDGEHIYRF